MFNKWKDRNGTTGYTELWPELHDILAEAELLTGLLWGMATEGLRLHWDDAQDYLEETNPNGHIDIASIGFVRKAKALGFRECTVCGCIIHTDGADVYHVGEGEYSCGSCLREWHEEGAPRNEAAIRY